MKLYYQMDVMLIFKAMDIIFQIVAGLVLLDEIEYYDSIGILLIFVSAFIIILGVVILILKHNFIEGKEQKKALGIAGDEDLSD